jgi:dolichyl-phosphate beta-glucosyltransferase
VAANVLDSRAVTDPLALSIVVPAYNEAARIGVSVHTLLAELPAGIGAWEIRVVDDGSKDDTAAIVEAIAATDPRVVLQREPHRGKGGALRAGLLAARGALRFMCDADLSMPPRELPRFLAQVPLHCEIAIGTREGAGAHRVGEPGHRHTMGRVFNFVVRASGLAGGQDTQCGFKMFTARAVESIMPYARIEGWAVDIEMLYLARLRGLRVKEVPIEWHYRDRSQVSPVGDSLRMSRDLLRIRLNALRGLYRER